MSRRHRPATKGQAAARPAAEPTDRAAGRAPTPAAAQSAPVRKAAWIVRGAALWLLVGALAKAFTGTPSELPAPILNADLDPFVVIPAAVVIETFVAILALVLPRVGWLPLAAALALFSAILVAHMLSGAEHCGCFGGAFPVPAWLMLGVDASLAVVVVAAGIVSRGATAAMLRSRGMLQTALGAGLVGLGLGWYADVRLRPLRPVETPAAMPSPSLGAAPTEGAARPPLTVPILPTPQPKAWSLPAQFPGEVILRPITWLNKPLAQTELGRWTDTSLFPPDAQLILYYESCNHCADHLRALAAKQEADPSAAPNYVLVQLPTPVAPGVRTYVDVVPKGLHVHLPKEITRWVITPPWDVWTEGGVVKRAERIKWPGEK